MDLCHERGLADIEAEDVWRRAGLESEAFHAEFDDLEDAFCQTYERERDMMFERYERASIGLTSWRDRLRATAYELYGSFRNEPRLARFLVIEAQSAGERAVRLQWEGVVRMFDLLDEGRDELEESEVVSRVTAEAIAGGLFQNLGRLILGGELPPTKKIVPQAMYMAVLPYLGPGPAEEELRIPPPPQFDDPD